MSMLTLERRKRRYVCTSGQSTWFSPACKGTMESMDADLRMTGEEMDGEEEELETDGFGLDLIIRRMIGELPTCREEG